MTKSATRIQDKDTQKRVSVVQSKEDPSKYWVVILNPDGTPIRWKQGIPWEAATIAVWTTTTWQPWTSASVTNSWTSSAAVFNFTIPEGEQGEQGETGNGIASVVATKSWKTTTVTISFTDGSTPYSFQILDWADWQWSWDVLWPSSSTQWHLATFADGTGKVIQDWWAIPTVPTNVSDFTNDAWYITGVDWGDIGGTLSDQTDLNNALWTKANSADLWTAASKNTWTSSWNVPVLDSNWKLATSILPWVALTDTYTVTNKSDLTSLSSAEQWDIGIVTSESKTYVLSQSPYSTAANWKELLTPTDSVTSVNWQTWAVTLDADDISDSTTTNKFVTATEKSTWSWKQDALSTQTAYTSKGTATKVPTITTNTLGQVTWITETSISFPVTSVNGSTWAVTVSEFNPWGTATTGYVLKKTADWYWWDAESWAVTSVNGQTGAVTVSEFTPTSAGSTDQVLTKTAGWYDWATPAASGIVCDSSSPIQIAKIRCWTESDYSNLGSYSSDTAYMTV